MSKNNDSSIGGFTILIIVVLVLGGLFGGGCAIASCTSIDPGHVGISVRKCSNQGVSQTPISPGYYWKSVFCEEVKEYPTSMQTIILAKSSKEGSKEDDSITATSSEGLPINVDVSMSFTLDPASVPNLYSKFRTDVESISNTYVRQTIREGLQETLSKYTAEQIYSDKKEFARAEVQNFLTDRLKDDGFVVTQFTFNEMRVPEQVTSAINAKVAMIQQAQKSLAEVKNTEALAQQRKAQAEGEAEATKLKADAESYANKKLSESLSPALVHYKALDKWDGKLPQFTGGNGALPFIQVPAETPAPVK